MTFLPSRKALPGKTLRLPALASLLLLCLLLPAVSARADLTILSYQRIGESRYPTHNVTLSRFRQQMAFLRDNNYRVLSLAEVVTALKNGRSLPDRAAVITVDDGYQSAYSKAWPVLEEFGYPFTVFLCAQAVEEGQSGSLSWGQIGEMRRAGVDFQDHGYSHCRLSDRPAGMDETA
ncbi:MAG: polysaccharide deacetylase family protein, partial [Desulfobulbaceae bacterium]|nr:polysaccharide deacetylase family protein [Desulfobulbaceae bacterium]